MDGAELIAHLRANPDTRNLLIVLMSAVPMDTATGNRIAYDHYLRKPFQDTELLALVDALLRADTA